MRLQSLITAFLFVSCTGKQTLNDHGGLSPEEGLRSLRVAPGFKVELFVSEPLVADPVAMEVDESGNVYVVEMHGYPLDKSGSGIVKLLKDKDQNGTPDEAIVYADGLTLPSGIMRWKKGVLVTDMPNLLYLEDSDGDGHADIRDTVITGMALSNPQHNGNTPMYGPDNWIYIAHESSITPVVYTSEFGDDGSAIRFVAGNHKATLPHNANGRNIRLKPDEGLLEMCAGESQYGHTFDPRGHHFFTANANHIFHEAIRAGYLQKNPLLQAGGATSDIPDHGNACKVYPITENPHVELLTDAGVITSSCGITWYKGGSFPDSFNNVTFIAEPVHNLVHADRIADKGASFTASRVYPKQEFLASTDPWFRPVQFYIGPDGALYVIDYYRQYIEHPEWMSEEVAASGQLYNGHTKGRIYRITPVSAPAAKWTGKKLIDPASASSLISALQSENDWYRRNAQRLIVEQADTSMADAIRKLIGAEQKAEQVISALWTLEGLHVLGYETVEQALRHPDGGVRENAVRLAESFLPNTALEMQMLTMKDDKDIKVRYQLLCTSGMLQDAVSLRNSLLLRDLRDPWFRVAALASSNGKEEEILAAMLGSGDEGSADMIRDIAALLALKDEEHAMMRLGALLKDPSTRPDAKTAILEGVNRKLEAGPIGSFAARNKIVQAAADQILPATQPLLRDAAAALLVLADAKDLPGLRQRCQHGAMDEAAALPYRLNCMQLLSIFPGSISREQAFRWLAPSSPTDLQVAAAVSYLRTDSSATTHLMAKWNEMSQPVRSAVMEFCSQDNRNSRLLLSGIANKTIQASSLPWHLQVSLMNHDDLEIRKWSRDLLSNQYGNRDKIVESYKDVLSQKGDAIKGQAVFQKNCSSCHTKGEEKMISFGPDLSSIANRDPSFILADILKPERSIADGFEWWDIQLSNGKTTGGIIGIETSTHIGLKDPSGKTTMINRNEIRSMKASDRSAMPQGLEKLIPIEDMADLIAYLKR